MRVFAILPFCYAFSFYGGKLSALPFCHALSFMTDLFSSEVGLAVVFGRAGLRGKLSA
jgi:hypothetical protein